MMPLLLYFFAVFSAQSGDRGVIGGRVTFADGTPAPGIHLLAVPLVDSGVKNPGARTSTTTEKGEYRFDGLPSGRYIVRTAPPDPSTFYPGVATESLAREIAVMAVAAVTGVDFSLTPATSGVTLSGHATLPPGSAQRYVRARTADNVIQLQSTAIGPDGMFKVEHVRAGVYSVFVSDSPGTEPLTLDVADRDIAGIELAAGGLAAVTGTATIEGGTVPAKLAVVFQSSRLRIPAVIQQSGAFAAQSGAFAAALPPGDYKVTVTGVPAGYYVKALPLRLQIPSAVAPVHLAFTLRPFGGVQVSGRVTAVSGSPGSSGLTLVHETSDQVFETRLDSGGSFELAQVMPGNYDLVVLLTSGVSTNAGRVEIPESPIHRLDIRVSGVKEIAGRVMVEGNGPSPRFSLLLVPKPAAAAVTSSNVSGELPAIDTGTIVSMMQNPWMSGARLIQLDVNALPDGSFRIQLPEGDYRVAAVPGPTGIPGSYALKSISQGGVDLREAPLQVADGHPGDVQIAFAPKSAWLSVSGRVRGADPEKGPVHVMLESAATATMQAQVNATGAFRFPSVLPENEYTLRLVTSSGETPASKVVVGDKDVRDVEIVVPPQKTWNVRTTVEGNGAISGFMLSGVVVQPDKDGLARVALPSVESRPVIRGLPVGYRSRLITETDAIRVVLTADAALPPGSVKGRLTGWDSSLNGAVVALTGVTAFSVFESPVGSDGSFSFERIPQGIYTASLRGTRESMRLTPSSILVAGRNSEPAALGMSRQTTAEETSAGASLTEIPSRGPGRVVVNESSVVADLRGIHSAESAYRKAATKYGGIRDLIAAGLLDTSFESERSGYVFSLIATANDYAAAAIPVSQDTGRYGFYIAPDAIIRYSTAEPFAPPAQRGDPIR